jgi:hypothetical protein
MYWRVISAIGNVEDVEVLAADQVQQQVERALERLEEDLERLGRDVEVLRHLQERLAAHDRERHLLPVCGGGGTKGSRGRCARAAQRLSECHVGRAVGSGSFAHARFGAWRREMESLNHRPAARAFRVPVQKV